MFEEEPAKENILFGNEKVVATPHLGASTTEAQENVALQVAEQISDYLLTGAITNALNMPSISRRAKRRRCGPGSRWPRSSARSPASSPTPA